MTEQRRTNSQKLDEIHTALIEIKHTLAERQHLDEKIQEHEEFINGNGKPGLKARMALLEDNVKRTNWIGGIIATAILIDVMTRILG